MSAAFIKSDKILLKNLHIYASKVTENSYDYNAEWISNNTAWISIQLLLSIKMEFLKTTYILFNYTKTIIIYNIILTHKV